MLSKLDPIMYIPKKTEVIWLIKRVIPDLLYIDTVKLHVMLSQDLAMDPPTVPASIRGHNVMPKSVYISEYKP